MKLIEVRATVHLHGIAPGETAAVDPKDPQIARWLRGGQLVELVGKPKRKK